MTSRTRETVLNVWLADELRKRGLDAKEESAQTGNRAIDPETVHTIRRSLAAEPSVTGKRYTGTNS